MHYFKFYQTLIFLLIFIFSCKQDVSLKGKFDEQAQEVSDIRFIKIIPGNFSSEKKPKIVGDAGGFSKKIKLFKDSQCSEVIGESSVTVFKSSGIAASVDLNSKTKIYAQGYSDQGVAVTQCKFMTNYTHDDTGPNVKIVGPIKDSVIEGIDEKTVLFNGTCEKSSGNVTLKLSAAASQLYLVQVPCENGNWKKAFDLSQLNGDEELGLVATQKDPLGNIGQDIAKYTLNFLPPTISLADGEEKKDYINQPKLKISLPNGNLKKDSVVEVFRGDSCEDSLKIFEEVVLEKSDSILIDKSTQLETPSGVYTYFARIRKGTFVGRCSSVNNGSAQEGIHFAEYEKLVLPVSEMGLSTLNNDPNKKWKSEDPNSQDASLSLEDYVHPEGIGSGLSEYYEYAGTFDENKKPINLVIDGCLPGAKLSISGDVDSTLSELEKECVPTSRVYPAGHVLAGQAVGQVEFDTIYFSNPSRSVVDAKNVNDGNGERKIVASQSYKDASSSVELSSFKRVYCSQFRSQFPPVDGKGVYALHGMWGYYSGPHWTASAPESDGQEMPHVICDWGQFYNVAMGRTKVEGASEKFVLAGDLVVESEIIESLNGAKTNSNFDGKSSLGYNEFMMNPGTGFHAEDSSGPIFIGDFDGNSKKLIGVNIGAGALARGSRTGLFWSIAGKVHDFKLVSPVANKGYKTFYDFEYRIPAGDRYYRYVPSFESGLGHYAGSRTGLLAAYSTSTAEIYNIEMTDIDVFLGNHVAAGVVVGSASGYFHDIKITGKFSSRNHYGSPGVIAGGLSHGRIENVDLDLEVLGNSASGFVGSMNASEVINSSFKGSITCTYYCAGVTYSGSGVIKNTKIEAVVKTLRSTGGIASPLVVRDSSKFQFENNQIENVVLENGN